MVEPKPIDGKIDISWPELQKMIKSKIALLQISTEKSIHKEKSGFILPLGFKVFIPLLSHFVTGKDWCADVG